MNKCKSCYFSEQHWGDGQFVLYCPKWNRDCATVSECDTYQYEPGTDAEEGDFDTEIMRG